MVQVFQTPFSGKVVYFVFTASMTYSSIYVARFFVYADRQKFCVHGGLTVYIFQLMFAALKNIVYEGSIWLFPDILRQRMWILDEVLYQLMPNWGGVSEFRLHSRCWDLVYSSQEFSQSDSADVQLALSQSNDFGPDSREFLACRDSLFGAFCRVLSYRERVAHCLLYLWLYRHLARYM